MKTSSAYSPLRMLLLAAIGLLTAQPALPAELPIEIGSRLEPMVDKHLIDKTTGGTRLRLHPPLPREVVWKPDAAWESTSAAYFTVFRDGELFRMYYRGSPRDMPDVVCMMTSSDGVQWERPKLGLFDFRGSKENNIVWTGGPFRTSVNFAPFRDTRPGVPDNERYKALAGSPIHAFASADGIHWRLLVEKPVLTGTNFDSQNVAFWDERRNCYVAFMRHRLEGNVRFVSTSTSADFRKWTERVPIDTGDAPIEHLYTNGTAPYFRAPHIYFSFMKRFVPERNKYNEGVSDVVFLTSRDGRHFDRTFLEALIRPGLDPRSWAARSNMPAWGLVQTGEQEMSIYYLQNYRTHGIQVRRGTFRLDGVASAHGGVPGGELTTKALQFKGSRLVLNFSTSAAGSIQVEIQDPQGKPVPGFGLSDCHEMFGDEIERAVSWMGGPDVGQLAGKPVRLRFVLRDADLYSLRFRKPD